MIVRPAREQDVPAIQAIVEACGLAADGIDYTKWTGIMLVAVRQSEVVGFLQCLPARPYAVVTEIGVLPQHQKGRACHELIKGLELILRGQGVTAWTGYVGHHRGLEALLSHAGAKSTGDGSMYIRSLA